MNEAQCVSLLKVYITVAELASSIFLVHVREWPPVFLNYWFTEQKKKKEKLLYKYKTKVFINMPKVQLVLSKLKGKKQY